MRVRFLALRDAGKHGMIIQCSMICLDWDYYTVNRLNETSVRFILDNSLRIQEMYESATLIGMKSWIAATMGNIYVLYGLLGALCVTLLAWEIFLFAPMINQTHEEQVRTLKMYAMLPKKPLMHMLTDVEEQVRFHSAAILLVLWMSWLTP